MPRAKTLNAYPTAHYMALIRRAHTTNQAIVVPLTRPQAATLRGELYAWRRAAEANPIQAQQMGIDLTMVRRVAFRIGDEGLSALPESLLAGPAAIEKVLGAIESIVAVPPPATPESEALQRLVGKLQGDSGPLPYNVKDDE